jgi:Co/Zn/Cd efflux system component
MREGKQHRRLKIVHRESDEHGRRQGQSLAVDAAFLHALSDMIMSIGVVIAASFIEYKTV